MIVPVLAAVFALIMPQQQGDPPGFFKWSAEELARRDAALSTSIGQDGSSRETLADFGNPTGANRFRLLRREGDGEPEQHGHIVDVVYVVSGEATLLVGGRLINPRGDPEETQFGDGIEGASRYPVGAGDIMHIPVNVPHSYDVPEGGHITYALTRVHAFEERPVPLADAPALTLTPPGTAIWRVPELQRRVAALGRTIGPNGDSRETLADFGNPDGAHRFRLIRRDRTGIPETHTDPAIADVVYVVDGAGAVLVGGEQVSTPGGNVGGVRHSIARGDMLHIPSGVPHSYIVPEGGTLTYVLVRTPDYVPGSR